MKHGPYCIPPDEVGDPGMCCCNGEWDDPEDDPELPMTLNEHAYYKERMGLRCREEGHRREPWHHDGEVRCKWCGAVLESKEYRDAVRRVLSQEDGGQK